MHCGAKIQLFYDCPVYYNCGFTEALFGNQLVNLFKWGKMLKIILDIKLGLKFVELTLFKKSSPDKGPGQSLVDKSWSVMAQTQESDHTFSAVSTMSMMV